MIYSQVDTCLIKPSGPIEEVAESQCRSKTTDIYRIWVHTVPVGSLAGYQEITMSLKNLCSPTTPNKRFLMWNIKEKQNDSTQALYNKCILKPCKALLRDYPYTSVEFQSSSMNPWTSRECLSLDDKKLNHLWPLFVKSSSAAPIHKILQKILLYLILVTIFNLSFTLLRVFINPPYWLVIQEIIYTRFALCLDSFFLTLDILLLLLSFLCTLLGEIFFFPLRYYLSTSTLAFKRGQAHVVLYACCGLSLLIVSFSLYRLPLTQKKAVFSFLQHSPYEKKHQL